MMDDDDDDKGGDDYDDGGYDCNMIGGVYDLLFFVMRFAVRKQGHRNRGEVQSRIVDQSMCAKTRTTPTYTYT